MKRKEIFLTFLFFTIFIYSLSLSFSQSWLSGWQYRIPITITERSKNTLTDYQVLVTINTQNLISQGKMRSDCGDIRFTDSDGKTLLNYWIESGCNSANTRIWVKVPNIPANSQKIIYLYYGNSQTTSASNATSTLVIYEDWSSGTLNGWMLRTTAPGYRVSITTTEGNPPPAVIISGDNFAADYNQFIYKTISKPKNIGLRIIADHAGYHGFYTSNVFTRYFIYKTDNTLVAFHDYSGDVNNVWIYNNEWIVNDSVTLSLTSLWVGFGLTDAWSANWNQYAIFDNIRVMYYVFPEPTVSLGNEETNLLFTAWANVTKSFSQVGNLCWRFYVNNSIGLWNSTPIDCSINIISPEFSLEVKLIQPNENSINNLTVGESLNIKTHVKMRSQYNFCIDGNAYLRYNISSNMPDSLVPTSSNSLVTDINPISFSLCTNQEIPIDFAIYATKLSFKVLDVNFCVLNVCNDTSNFYVNIS
ncbi:MAG: DUF2341 domain-containing protein, partial [Candidatus Aenigmatarchaeota archaeon]